MGNLVYKVREAHPVHVYGFLYRAYTRDARRKEYTSEMSSYISQLILLSTGMPGEDREAKKARMDERERVKAEVAELKTERAEAKAKITEAQRRKKEAYGKKNERGENAADFFAAEYWDEELTKYVKKFEELTTQIDAMSPPKPVLSEEEKARKNRMAWLRNHINEEAHASPSQPSKNLIEWREELELLKKKR